MLSSVVLFFDFAENDFYATMQPALVTCRGPLFDVAFSGGFIDEREGRSHNSPDVGRRRRLGRQSVPHRAELVTQTRLCVILFPILLNKLDL